MRFDSRGLVSTYISDWMPVNPPGFEGFGYFALARSTTTVNKMSTASEVVTTLATGLNTTMNDLMCGFANSGVAGYISVNSSASPNKFSFPSDTRSIISASTSSQSRASAACSNNGTAGYIFGGADPISNAIQKLTYSSDAISVIGAVISNSGHYGAAFSNSGVAGYYAGGTTDGNTRYSTVDKLTFSSETKAALGTGLTTGMWYHTGFANSGFAGYIAGGQESVKVNYIDKFLFSTDTKSTLASTLATARAQTECVGTTASKSNCYIAGGADAGGFISSVIALSSTEITSVITSTIGATAGASFADCGSF